MQNFLDLTMARHRLAVPDRRWLPHTPRRIVVNYVIAWLLVLGMLAWFLLGL